MKKPKAKHVAYGGAGTLGAIATALIGYGELRPQQADPNLVMEIKKVDNHVKSLDTQLKINNVETKARMRDLENRTNRVENLQRIYHP